MGICLTNSLPICSDDCPMLRLDYEDLYANGYVAHRIWTCANRHFCNEVLRHLTGKLRPALEHNGVDVNELAATLKEALQNDK